jgi:hypothetical protein
MKHRATDAGNAKLLNRRTSVRRLSTKRRYKFRGMGVEAAMAAHRSQRCWYQTVLILRY